MEQSFTEYMAGLTDEELVKAFNSMGEEIFNNAEAAFDEGYHNTLGQLAQEIDRRGLAPDMSDYEELGLH
jgi:hypothetical protein